jgi:uncharacterized protein
MDVDDLYRQDGDGRVLISVHVQPASGRSAVVGRHGSALKVKVAAPPEGGRANEACAAVLAETFGVQPAQAELVSGAQSRAKRFRLSGLDLDEFRRRLEQAVMSASAPKKPRDLGPK